MTNGEGSEAEEQRMLHLDELVNFALDGTYINNETADFFRQLPPEERSVFLDIAAMAAKGFTLSEGAQNRLVWLERLKSERGIQLLSQIVVTPTPMREVTGPSQHSSYNKGNKRAGHGTS